MDEEKGITKRHNHKEAKTSPWALLRFYSRTELALNALALVMAVASGAAQPLMTLFFGNLTTAVTQFGRIVDSYDPSKPDAQSILDDAARKLRHEANTHVLYFVYIGLGLMVATYLYTAIFTYTAQCLADRLREEYLRALLRQEMSYFDDIGGSANTSVALETKINQIQAGAADKVPIVVMHVSTFGAGIIMAYVRAWKLALVLSSIIPALVITGLGLESIAGKFKNKATEYAADATKLAMECLNSVDLVRSYGMASRLTAIYDDHLARSAHQGRKRAIYQGASHGLVFAIIYATYALAFYFGAKLLSNGELSEGTIVNVFLSVLIGSFALASIGPAVTKMTIALGAWRKILPVIHRHSAIDPTDPSGVRTGLADLEVAQHAAPIHLDNVSFYYPSRPDSAVLRSLSLHIQPHKLTAIVGPSGSGKSTIVSLLERFYDVSSGTVYLAGQDVRQYSPAYLRSAIGVVTQDTALFSGSIAENVAVGLIGTQYEHAPAHIQQQLVETACKRANAWDFVQAAGGLDALVRQDTLSGGQRARLNIARACVRRPAFLILDEPTASLDAESESKVHEEVQRLTAHSTVLVVAHRLATVRRADRIIVLAEGELKEQGTHEELIAHQGIYATMCQQQQFEGNDVSEDDIIPTADDDSSSLVAKERFSSHGDRSDERLADAVQRRPSARSQMWALWRQDPWVWKLYLVGSLGAIVFGMIYPVYTIVFGKVLLALQKAGTDSSTLRHVGSQYAVYIVIIAVVAALSLGGSSWVLDSGAERLGRQIRTRSFGSILHNDAQWFHSDADKTAGALICRLDSDASNVTSLSGPALGIIVQGITTIIGGAIIALSYGWKLALVTIACYPLTISAGIVQLWAVGLRDARLERSSHESANVANESLRHIRIITAYNGQEQAVRRYLDSRRGPGAAARKEAFQVSFWYALSNGSSFLVIALGFWYGLRLVSQQEYDTQQLITVFSAIVFGSTQAGYVFAYAPDMSSARQGMASALSLMSDEHHEDRSGTTDPSALEATFNLQGVSFGYRDTDKEVLSDVDIGVASKSTVALTGPSGCGKSTLLAILQRFVAPSPTSRVLFGGHDIYSLSIDKYRAQMSVVGQNDTLFSGTLRFNLELGCVTGVPLTDAEALDACRKANILDFVQSLPRGLDTVIGDSSASGLSGGQRARLTLARALVRNPRVLLLDEVTSSLDAMSEKIIEQTLHDHTAQHGMTTIQVAHRLSSIKKADNIYVLRAGRVAEQGTFAELVRQDGLFASLVANQQV